MDNAQLKAIATSLETKAGASTTANDSREGWWKRIAAASETIAGASTTANDGLEGYILRSAKAMEVLSATSGAEETDGYTGFLKRFVDALEVKSGTVGTSDMDSRAVTAAENAVFNAYAAYALALDFKNGAYWVGGAQAANLAALPGYSYTRTGAKAERNALTSGDVIDDFADNVPGIVPGVGYWSRGAVTNLLTYSQEMDHSAWAKNQVTVTPNDALAPDGTLTADKVTVTAGVSFHHLVRNVSLVGTQTVSIFLKAGTHRYVQLLNDANAGASDFVNFDLQTGTMSAAASGHSGSITAFGGGWYRCSYTGPGEEGATLFGYYISAVSSLTAGRAENYNAAGAETFYAWQGQLVAGSDPGPIIPTGAAAASVGADVMTLSSPVSADQDFIIYSTIDVQNDDAANKSFFTLSDGTFGNYIYVYRHATLGPFVSIAPASINFGSGSTQMKGLMTLLLRRKAGAYSLFSKNHATGVIAASVPSVGAYPVGMTQINVGSFIGGEQPNSPLLQTPLIKTGTFTDAEITTLLGAL